MRRRSNIALRLQTSLLSEVRKIAEEEGVAVNQFINVAVAEKLSALRTEDYFRERAERANSRAALAVLKKAGRGMPPVPGDEIRRVIPSLEKRNRAADVLRKVAGTIDSTSPSEKRRTKIAGKKRSR